MNQTHLSKDSFFVLVSLWAIFLILLVSNVAFASGALDKYLAAFKDPRGEVRRTALEQLYKCLRDAEEGNERNPMCPGETSSGEHDQLLTAISGLLADPEPKVREAAVGYLSTSTDVRVIQPIARLLRDSNDDVRAAAARSFYLIQVDDLTVRELERLLRDNNKTVRMAAASSLGLSGTKRSLGLLRDAIARETDDEVRRLYSEVVKELEKRFPKKNKK